MCFLGQVSPRSVLRAPRKSQRGVVVRELGYGAEPAKICQMPGMRCEV